MAQWLSWLERRPVTAEVESSSLFWVVLWDLSSAGRASALQAEGHRFEPCRSHMDGFPSGQRGQTVNLLRLASVVRIHLHPLAERRCADVAQLAEQLICNQQVIGSSPIIGFVLRNQYNIVQLNMRYFGWIPEWPKGTDCKSAANCFGGSNPPPSIG